MNSPIPKLLCNKTPVNKDAARVAFSRGEHYSPACRDARKNAHTWRYPPVAVGCTPKFERDWKGHRVGRMTAIYWYRPGRGKNPSVWIARCDCGNYEARVPERWVEFLPKRFKENDGCAVCKDTDDAIGPGLKIEQRGTRVGRFFNGLLVLGLSFDEAVDVMKANITVIGLTADQIRQRLAEAHGKGGIAP